MFEISKLLENEEKKIEEVAGSKDIATDSTPKNDERKSLSAASGAVEGDVPVPEGWRRQVVQRQSGLSAGKFDIYYFSPAGKKLRSRNEVENYCKMYNLDIDIEKFYFRRIAPGTPLEGRRKSAPGQTSKQAKPKKITTPKSEGTIKKRVSGPKSPMKKNKGKIEKVKPKKLPMKVSTDHLMKKKMKKSLWVPPKSPFNLFQESLFQNPWKLLVGTIFHSKLSNDELLANSLFWSFLKKWPSPESVISAEVGDMAVFLQHMPHAEKMAKLLKAFSDDFLNKPWVYPKELQGIGKYGNDSYRVFCVNEWKKVRPTDYLLNFYVSWVWDNCTVLGLL